MPEGDEKPVAWFWIFAPFIALGALIGKLHVLFYYFIVSLYRTDSSLTVTLRDLALSMSMRTTQLNILVLMIISFFICLLTLPVLRLKKPLNYKIAVVVGLDNGLFMTILLMVRLATFLDERSAWITILGLAGGLIVSGLLVYLNIKMYLGLWDKNFGFELSFMACMIMIVIGTFLRLLIFDRYRPQYYWPLYVSAFTFLSAGAMLAFFYHLLRTRPGRTARLLHNLLITVFIIDGLIFASGSLKRFTIISRMLDGTAMFSAAAKDSPNVILIVWDTVRADHLSLYNYERPTTPFLDSLAPDSVVFNRAYSTSSVTVPSHASLFTGMYSSENRCHYENPRLDPGFTTLAETLREKGYVTKGLTNNVSLNPFNGFAQGFDLYEINYRYGNFTGDTLFFAVLSFFLPEIRRDNGAAYTRHQVENWLRGAKDQDHPFFLFLNYMEAHQTYPRVKMAFSFFPDPEEAFKRYGRSGLSWDYYTCTGGISETAQGNIIKWYDGSIYYLDLKLELLYESLKNYGLLDNTIIILTSDHGESFGEHGIFGHMSGLYLPNIHIPLLVHWPGRLKPMRSERVTSLREVPEIILSLVDNRIPGQLKNQEPGGEVFAENYKPLYYLNRLRNSCGPGRNLSGLERRQRALINADYEFIWDSKGENHLYSLKEDPQQLLDIYAKPGTPSEAMEKRINDFIQAYHSLDSESLPHSDRETARVLKSIGYAH